MNEIKNIGFGCVGLSTHSFEHDALNLLNKVFDEGITHFDTAPIYGKGYSEKLLGKFLKTHQTEVTITTKFGLSSFNKIKIPASLALPLNFLKNKIKNKSIVLNFFQEPNLIPFRKIDLKEIQLSIEYSLRNLSVDHIDNFLLHEALPNFLTDEAMHYILTLKSKGIVNNIGIAASYNNISNLKLSQIADWDILQYENSMLHASQNLINIFADKLHIYHSIFKPIQYSNYKVDLKNDIAGILLARAVKLNPKGKSLFSSTNIKHIQSNLKVMELYSNYSLNELNNILANAVY